MKFKVYELTGKSFSENENLIGEFSFFEQAHKFAQDNICPDLSHEGSCAGIGHSYYFSDEGNNQTSYKCHIDCVKE
jgi:hypothetical protein